MSGSVLTPEQMAAYQRDGHVIVPGLFDTEEIALLRAAIETDPALQQSLYDRRDTAGKATACIRFMTTRNHCKPKLAQLSFTGARIWALQTSRR